MSVSFTDMWNASSINQSMDDFEPIQRDDAIQPKSAYPRSIYVYALKSKTTDDTVLMYENGLIFLNGERVDKDAPTND